ncbi:MAG TPA: SDR family NAD(P)-dependent oxidoreductase [Planctomycetota bacterium]|jgi:3-oxoacyl-[acyl-carrier protein] reductase|nr:SDR family NAD(P)-dependent oxidoreductase [Planctomycetota bacterium]
MSELSGRTAVITGAARGIGLAIARALGQGGARVVLVSRDGAALAQAAEALAAEDIQALPLAADINDEGWLTELDELAPQVDVLVNNAAAFATYGRLPDVELDEVDQVLQTCLRSALRLARHVLPGMTERGFGRIIQIGSMAGSLGAAGQVAYASAKSGLVGLTTSIAVETGRRGITSNLLELGLVCTERTESEIPQEIRAHLTRNTPLGRPGTPEEVAAVAAFLATPAAAYITGAVIPVSGGLGLGLYPEQLG